MIIYRLLLTHKIQGIVTRFTLKTFPQTDVWVRLHSCPQSLAFPLHIDGKGGLITIAAPHIPDVAAATANFFANVQDPKASIITTYNFLLGQASFWILRISDFIYSWQLELIAWSIPASFLRCPHASTWDI